MKISVLGQEYDIVQDESIRKTDNADGLCQRWERLIKIAPPESMLDDGDPVEAKMKRYEEVLRHEIVHAFFAESGLDGYCVDEVLVDWIAHQFPKMQKVFAECKCSG